MYYKKITEILKSLDYTQREKLTDFIHSPYFSKSDSVTTLYDYLKSLHPEYHKSKVSDDALMKSIKGIGGKNELAKKMTRLLELINQFLSIEYNRDPVLEHRPGRHEGMEFAVLAARVGTDWKFIK